MAEFNIDKLNIQITANATKASNALDKLTSKIGKLQQVLDKAAPKSERFSKSMTSLSKTTKAIDVKPLNSLSSTLKTITGQESAINRLTSSLTRLSTTSKKVTASTKSSTSSSGGATGLLGIFGKLGSLALVYYGLRRVGQGLAYAAQESIHATEVMNLFNVSLGENAAVAKEFVDNLASGTGFDPVVLSENTAIFYQIANSMGLAADKSLTLSKNFTKLAIDLASLREISLDEAFTKLGAGLVGETEPLRRIGIILTENNLAETASRLGIEKSIRTMTEAEKIQLRYVTLLQQTTAAQGDLGRTIESPANQLRILSDQFTLLTRSIGHFITNAIAPALPYIIAFTNVITTLITRFGELLGIGALDFSSSSGSSNGAASFLEDIEDAATGASKALKGVLAPFDELNVLSAQSSSASGIGGIGASGLIDIDLEDYDNLIGDVEPKWQSLRATIEEALGKVKEFFSGVDTTNLVNSLNNLKVALAPFVSGFATGLGWFIQNVLKPLTEWTINELLPISIDLLATGFGLLGDMLKPLLPLLKPLWDNYLSPAIKKVGEGLIKALQTINETLAEIRKLGLFQWILKALNRFGIDTEKVGKKIKKVYVDYIKPYLDSWGEEFSDLYKDDLKPFLDDVRELTDDIIKLFEVMNIDLGVVLGGTGAIILGKLYKIKDIFINVTRFLTQEFDSIVLQIDGLVKILTGLIDGDIRLSVEGLATYLEGFVNMFASALNGIINSFVDGINRFIRAVNPILEYMGQGTLPELKNVDLRVDYTSVFGDDYEDPNSNRRGGTGSFGTGGGSGSFGADNYYGISDATGGGLGSFSTGGGSGSFGDDIISGFSRIVEGFMDAMKEQNNRDIILEVDGTELGKASMKAQDDINRQKGGYGGTRPIKSSVE